VPFRFNPRHYNERSEKEAGLVAQLDLCPAESVVRTVWDTCNHLLDLPEDSFAQDDYADESVTGDEVGLLS
jgi:hypothetical protein